MEDDEPFLEMLDDGTFGLVGSGFPLEHHYEEALALETEEDSAHLVSETDSLAMETASTVQNESIRKQSSKKNVKPTKRANSVKRTNSVKPLPRRARSASAPPRFAASPEEMYECTTNRDKEALETFYRRINELAQFKEDHGHCNVPQKYPPNKELGTWVNKTRQEKKKKDAGKETKLNDVKVAKLDELEFNWGENKGMTKWNERYRSLVEFFESEGHCNVPTRGYEPNKALGRWVSTQRTQYRYFMEGERSLLTQTQINLLQAINFRWDMRTTASESDNNESPEAVVSGIVAAGVIGTGDGVDSDMPAVEDPGVSEATALAALAGAAAAEFDGSPAGAVAHVDMEGMMLEYPSQDTDAVEDSGCEIPDLTQMEHVEV